MRRQVALGALLLAGVLSIGVSAYQQASGGRAAQAAPATPSAAALTVDKLKDSLYVIRGGGAGNTAAFITTNGVVVVDTKLPGWGQTLIDKIKTFTDKPITMIINTHAHADHVGGNVEFPANVEVVTHANSKQYMNEANPVTGLQTGPQPNIFKENGGRGMPTRTFTKTLTLGSGAERIDLFYFGRAHTGGDAFVVFPALQVMHVGDTFAGKDLPIMDKNNGGSGVEYADTLAKAAKGIAGVDMLITGHAATTMTMADLREFSDFNNDFVGAVRAAKKSGQTVDEFAAGWKTPARYTGYATPQPARIKSDAQVVWDELK